MWKGEKIGIERIGATFTYKCRKFIKIVELKYELKKVIFLIKYLKIFLFAQMSTWINIL